MKLVTPGQMNQIDKLAINKIGIPGIVLMENAALKTVDEIIKMLGILSDKRIIVLAGKGNNGGDAFAVSRHLFNKGASVAIYTSSQKQFIEGDAKTNLDIIAKMGVHTIEITGKTELEELKEQLRHADLAVDGLLGTGIKGEVKGIIKDIIEAVNEAGVNVISIDIPSGIDGESGKVCGCSVKAQKTVTFGLPKIGQVIHPGCDHTGELVVADIGIPEQIIDELDLKACLIDWDMAAAIIPPRSGDSNKGDYGKVFILSGSVGMTGAGCLTAGAALRTGAGLIYLGVPAILSSIYDAALLESVTIPLEDAGLGCLSKEGLGSILDIMKRATVAAVGPGLSVNDEIVEIIGTIIEKSSIPLVMDADALNAISRDVNMLGKRKAEMVITPHPGEMARLMGISTEEVQENRLRIAADFAQKWGVITVLKGSRTVVACPEGTIYINTTGNSGMATGGTGDVLTGIIAGLIGQGAGVREAAVAGVYIHGMAGDNSARIKGEHGIIAGDVVREIPFIIKKLIKCEHKKNVGTGPIQF